ncbi:MAG: hypothetical protein GYB65_19060, partial [Chloroflexi bacterium]|nr:hypothetical protein [Chloroflexota bacterium]
AITWHSPAAGSEVYGMVRLEVAVSDADALTDITFSVDDVPLASIPAADREGYTAEWLAANWPDGEHTLLAVAHSDADDLGQAAITVTVNTPTRANSIPADAVKITPATDQIPPLLNPAFANIWENPVPLGAPVNTAGLEDSAFISPDGSTLYFFFTPDYDVPPDQQLFDGVTGIYRAERTNGTWSEPERVYLNTFGQESLEGAHTLLGDRLWFGSIRQGNYGEIDMWIAEWQGDHWANWTNAGELLNGEYDIGELDFTGDGRTMVFDSSRAGGLGQKDIWITYQDPDGAWSAPENIAAVNTSEIEGWPYITPDGSELWFTRYDQGVPVIYRTLNVNGVWQPPELIVSQFAGEPALDSASNLYFIHHYIQNSTVIEADIYFAARK